MTSQKRLENAHSLLKDVIENVAIRDYIETGGWRGGSSVLPKVVLEVHDQILTLFHTALLIHGFATNNERGRCNNARRQRYCS